MTEHQLFEELKKLSLKYIEICAKCGQCRVICPVYENTGKEPSTARAKISLVEALLSERFIPGKRFNEIISQCTLCMGCMEKCPNDVRVDLIVAVGRFISNENHFSIVKSLLFRYLLMNSKRLGFTLKTIRPFQRFALRNSSLLPRLFKRRYIPKIANKFIREKFGILAKAGAEKGRITFFPGCLLDFFFPETGESLINILNLSGLSVFIPDRWACCGIPAIGYGDLMNAYRMAVHNARLLGDCGGDLILTACGSCGATLREHAPFLFGWAERKIEDVGKRVRDIMEFIHAEKEIRHIFQNINFPKKIFYHPSCHLKRGMGVHGEVLEVIKDIKGIHLTVMEDRCCGFGGSFNLKWYEFSSEIGERRVMVLKEERPDYLLTGSPGCAIHFQDLLLKNGLHIKIVHPVVMLKEALLSGQKIPL